MEDFPVEEMWKVLLRDPGIQTIPRQALVAIKPYYFAAPLVLESLLGEEANVKNINKAKLEFNKYCVMGGYVDAYLGSMPDAMFGFLERNDIASLMRKTILRIIGKLTVAIITNTKKNENPIGLGRKAMKLYKKGELTVGKLLELQPGIILLNKRNSA